uniref:Uncharacterized protein n=1 Tax=Oryza rufipogon TaxID=4529 RepID=A0A0E0RF19_ORYRU
MEPRDATLAEGGGKPTGRDSRDRNPNHVLKLIDSILSLLNCIPELPQPCIKVFTPLLDVIRISYIDH